jgi:hypothetical protein
LTRVAALHKVGLSPEEIEADLRFGIVRGLQRRDPAIDFCEPEVAFPESMRMREKESGKPLPDGRGSVTVALISHAVTEPRP